MYVTVSISHTIVVYTLGNTLGLLFFGVHFPFACAESLEILFFFFLFYKKTRMSRERFTAVCL